MLVSSTVRETVIGRLSCTFEDLGEQALKNIARSLRVYRAGVEPAVPRPAHAVSDRPSIAVLPFQNISGDPEQEYFADGMVEEIITGLSRVRWFFVVSRSSSFTYRGRAVDVRQVGRELGVRYVLEGSVRKATSRVRITGQLIDATNGQHIWADRFDGDLEDVFELQDRVTESVVGAIEPNLLTAEIRRAKSKPTESLDAYDLYLRTAPLTHARTRLSLDSAIALSRQALLLDPAFAAAKGMLVHTYVLRIFQGWAEPGDAEAAIALARECAIDGWSDPVALARAGHALAILAEEPEEGVALLKRAMYLNPNSSLIQAFAGFVYCTVGQPKPAIECLSQALKLNPLGPEVRLVAAGLGFAHLLAGRLAEALDLTERAMHSASDFHPALRFRIAVLMCAGQVEEGRAMARRLLAADPAFRLSTRHIPRGGLDRKRPA